MFSPYSTHLLPLSRSLRLTRHARPEAIARRFLSTLPPPAELRPQPRRTPKEVPSHNADSKPNPDRNSNSNSDKTSKPDTTAPPRPRRIGSRIITVFFSICIGLTVSEHVLNINWVSGPSMAPYLNKGYGVENLNRDIVLVDKTLPGRSDLKRGMVVIFPTLNNPKQSSVKRIIALPGDRVTTRPSPNRTAPQTSHIVPYNYVWVEGDADDDRLTLDSNKYGPISMSLISGRVICSLRPWPKLLRWQGWEEGEDEFQSGGETGKRQRMRVEKNVVAVKRPPSSA